MPSPGGKVDFHCPHLGNGKTEEERRQKRHRNRPEQCDNGEITTRIPLQSAARSSLADSFPPGEAMAPLRGAVAPTGRHIY